MERGDMGRRSPERRHEPTALWTEGFNPRERGLPGLFCGFAIPMVDRGGAGEAHS